MAVPVPRVLAAAMEGLRDFVDANRHRVGHTMALGVYPGESAGISMVRTAREVANSPRLGGLDAMAGGVQSITVPRIWSGCPVLLARGVFNKWALRNRFPEHVMLSELIRFFRLRGAGTRYDPARFNFVSACHIPILNSTFRCCEEANDTGSWF